MTPEVMASELARLPDDLADLEAAFAGQLAAVGTTAALRDLTEVVLVGSGDSLHAALAAQLAFHRCGGIAARALSTHEFAGYGPEWLMPRPRGRRLVVVVSASGRTPGALTSAAVARAEGVTVACVVGDGSAPLTACGDLTLSYDLPGKVPAPGIRTYQASLTGLLLLAAHIGGVPGRDTRQRLHDIADGMRRAHPLQRQALDAAGGACDSPVIFLGAGPNRGTAKHAAAKVVEASGVFAVGQEIEEWWHIERMADPATMTTFIIVTERSAARAAEVAAAARERGRRVVIVAPSDMPPVLAGSLVLPVAPGAPEELSPLAFQGFGVHVAGDLARALGRTAFLGGDVRARAPRLS